MIKHPDWLYGDVNTVKRINDVGVTSPFRYILLGSACCSIIFIPCVDVGYSLFSCSWCKRFSVVIFRSWFLFLVCFYGEEVVRSS